MIPLDIVKIVPMKYFLLILLCLAFASSFIMPMDLLTKPDVWRFRLFEPEYGYKVFDELINLKHSLTFLFLSLAILPNIIFLISVTLLLMEKYRLGFYTASIMLGLMIVWAILGFTSLGAFSLWLASGIGLFSLQLKLYKEECSQSLSAILYLWPMKFIYVIIFMNIILFLIVLYNIN